MDIFSALFLGIIEGLTEFLPISSTAHLLLAGKLMGLPSTDFQNTFVVVIQVGAILAIAAQYAQTALRNRSLMAKLVVAFLPTAVIGFALYKAIKGAFDNYSLILWMLFLGGLALILFEYWYKSRREAGKSLTAITYRDAFLIGCAQSLAVIPGVSRAGATILGGLKLGIERSAIVEFSFLLAVPTMLAASGYDLLKSDISFDPEHLEILAIGLISSFIAAYAAVKLFLAYVRKHSFISFGIYRMIFAVVLWQLIY